MALLVLSKRVAFAVGLILACTGIFLSTSLGQKPGCSLAQIIRPITHRPAC